MLEVLGVLAVLGVLGVLGMLGVLGLWFVHLWGPSSSPSDCGPSVLEALGKGSGRSRFQPGAEWERPSPLLVQGSVGYVITCTPFPTSHPTLSAPSPDRDTRGTGDTRGPGGTRGTRDGIGWAQQRRAPQASSGILLAEQYRRNISWPPGMKTMYGLCLPRSAE